VPVDHLHALRELAAHFRQYDLSRTTVVSRTSATPRRPPRFARLIGAQVAAGANSGTRMTASSSAPSSVTSPAGTSSC